MALSETIAFELFSNPAKRFSRRMMNRKIALGKWFVFKSDRVLTSSRIPLAAIFRLFVYSLFFVFSSFLEWDISCQVNELVQNRYIQVKYIGFSKM